MKLKPFFYVVLLKIVIYPPFIVTTLLSKKPRYLETPQVSNTITVVLRMDEIGMLFRKSNCHDSRFEKTLTKETYRVCVEVVDKVILKSFTTPLLHV